MKKTFLFFGLLVMALGVQCQSTHHPSDFEPLLEAFKESLNEKNFSLLAPHLHGDYRFQDYKGPMAVMIMTQVVNGYPLEVKSITIEAVESTSEGYKLQARFVNSKEEETHELRVSDDFKLLQADIVEISLPGHGDSSGGEESAYFFNLERPQRQTIPLILKDRNMFVEAEINGKRGLFYLDTGAPSLILNAAAFSEDEVDYMANLEETRSGATGDVEGIRRVMVNHFSLGGLKGENIEAVAYDLAHLEEGVLGMVGVDVLEGYLAKFDLQNARLELYDKELPAVELNKVTLGMTAVTVQKMGHLPVVPMQIGGQNVNLVLESGAGSAMINPSYEPSLKGHSQFVEKDSLKGQGKNVMAVDVYNLDVVKIGGKQISEARTLFIGMPGSGEHSHGFELAGLIGWDVFEQLKVVYDLDENQIYFGDLD